MNNISASLLKQLRKRMIPIIQDVYDSWLQNTEGYDSNFGYGGIAEEVFESISAILSKSGIVNSVVTHSVSEQHTYTLAEMFDGIFLVDINPIKYQFESDNSWYKIPNIVFCEDDITISLLDSDNSKFDQYINENYSMQHLDKVINIRQSMRIREAVEPDIQILKGVDSPAPSVEQPAVSISGSTSGSTSGDTVITQDTPQPAEIKKFNTYEPKEIKVDVENKNTVLLNKLIEDLSLVIKKRSIKNLRIVSIKGAFDKLDTTKLKFNKLIIYMSNGDIIIGEYMLVVEHEPNIKITLNDEVVFDLEYKTYTIDEMIDKISDVYKKYLISKNWKLK